MSTPLSVQGGMVVIGNQCFAADKITRMVDHTHSKTTIHTIGEPHEKYEDGGQTVDVGFSDCIAAYNKAMFNVHNGEYNEKDLPSLDEADSIVMKRLNSCRIK